MNPLQIASSSCQMAHYRTYTQPRVYKVYLVREEMSMKYQSKRSRKWHILHQMGHFFVASGLAMVKLTPKVHLSFQKCIIHGKAYIRHCKLDPWKIAYGNHFALAKASLTITKWTLKSKIVSRSHFALARYSLTMATLTPENFLAFVVHFSQA